MLLQTPYTPSASHETADKGGDQLVERLAAMDSDVFRNSWTLENQR